MKANASRMLGDFRATIPELLLDEYIKVWTHWAELYDAGICNRANGSPNIPAAA